MTRESWLLEAMTIASKDLFGVIPDLPALPPEVRVTCGWPSKGGLGKKETYGRPVLADREFRRRIH